MVRCGLNFTDRSDAQQTQRQAPSSYTEDVVQGAELAGEPAWKKFGVHNEIDAISHLHEKIAKIEELIGMISPEKKYLLEKNRIFENAYRACSISEIRRFQHKTKFNQVKTLSKLNSLTQKVNKENSIEKMVIYGSEKKIFLIYPL